ncbi:hypothetical protein [Streptomyces sp. NPDC050704]|uniref:hypothetical protein n=1 Tax=Streptomyces sp. NPDC050704 TaxID=3157219 RepID=UPI00344AA8BC
MDERRGEQPAPQPCLCGKPDHQPIRDGSLLRCPHRELPKADRWRDEIARGVCWVAHPDTGVHCTEPPHQDGDHRNAYTGNAWPRTAAIEPR